MKAGGVGRAVLLTTAASPSGVGVVMHHMVVASGSPTWHAAGIEGRTNGRVVVYCGESMQNSGNQTIQNKQAIKTLIRHPMTNNMSLRPYTVLLPLPYHLDTSSIITYGNVLIPDKNE